jgi:predicted NAD-dependent protein-ADP-ribosyltransferase YbiA (DUF1768 family)
MNHRLDNDNEIFFYENEFYCFSNFSAFTLMWKGKLWPTSEQAYQSEKFDDEKMKENIRTAPSAHEAFKFALDKDKYIQIGMEKTRNLKEIIREKIKQHPYVLKKLKDRQTSRY